MSNYRNEMFVLFYIRSWNTLANNCIMFVILAYMLLLCNIIHSNNNINKIVQNIPIFLEIMPK